MRFIMSFTPDNMDQCIEIAVKAGVPSIYHPGPFETWGHFKLNKKSFPDSIHSMKWCVDRAEEKGIIVGLHTLSNFITRNDEWVSPIPHPDLVLAGKTILSKSISESEENVTIRSAECKSAYDKDEVIPTKHNENKNREAFAIRIGNEIIEYSSVIEEGDNLILQKCKRGAYGTTASAHTQGDTLGRLVSHYYKVFFPNMQLQDQMAKNLANLFNKTGLKRLSFDGFEGTLATGHGRYAGDRFVDVFFNNLKDKNILTSSSDLSHWAWHYISSESWGEPWWAKGFRESQLGHRIEVQSALEQDFMPRKMGQFSLKKNTTFKDIQWVMGLCAGLDSGLDFYVSPQFLETHPDADKILSEIKRWEDVRYNQLLTQEQKETLKDPLSIYALDESNGQLKLSFVESWMPTTGKVQGDTDRNTLRKGVFDEKTGVVSFDYKHVNMQKEPGMPTFAEWNYTCKKNQKLQFAIRLPKSREPIKGIYLKVGAKTTDIPFTLQAGDYVCTVKGELIHYNKRDEIVSSSPYNGLDVPKGKNTVLFDYEGKGRVAGPEVIVNFYSSH
jgi:hypothetical protein